MGQEMFEAKRSVAFARVVEETRGRVAEGFFAEMTYTRLAS